MIGGRGGHLCWQRGPKLGMGSAESLNRVNNTGGRESADQIKLELLAFTEILGVRGA
jgi:hypothetical protein